MVIIAQGKYTVKSQVDTTGFSKIQQQVNLSIKQLEKMRVSSKNVFNEFSKGGKEAQNRAKLLEGELKDINAQLIRQYQLQDKADKTIVTALKQRQKLANAELQTMKAANAAHTQGLSDIIVKVGKFAVATAILGGFTTAIYKGVEAIFELDKSMTELNKVTDMSTERLARFKDQAFELGAELGKTGSQVVDATTEFAKAGYSVSESLELAKTALLFQNIADESLTAGESASFIISQMKAFNFTASESIQIIDKINEVSNNYAVSSGQLSQNIGKVASAVASSGVTYDELLALMTAGIEVNRNASKTANSIKSVSTRLKRMDADGEIPKLEKQFNEFGMSMVRADGYTKNVFETLRDFAPIYNEIIAEGTPEQVNKMNKLLENIAGVYNISALQDVLKNFDTANKVVITSLNAQGSAMQENEKYMQSLEARVNLLNSAYSQLVNNTVDTGFVKFLIDSATGFIKILDTSKLLLPILVGLAAGTFPMLITMIGALNVKLAATGVALGFATGGFSTLIALLAGGATLLFAWTNGLDSFSKEIEQSNEAFREQIKEVDISKVQLQEYLRIIDDLQAKEKLSAEEKMNMKLAVEGLNSVMPTLNAEIDSSTGKLKTNITQVKKAADEYINLAKARLYASMIEQQSDKIASLMVSKGEAEERLRSGGGIRNVRAVVGTRQQATIQIVEADRKIIALRENLNELLKEADKFGDTLVATEDIEDEGSIFGDDAGGNVSKAADALEELNKAFDTHIKSLEHELYLMEQRKESEEDRVAFMRKIQEAIHNQANYYRSLNLAETSSEIQSLQKMWWQYENNIATIRLNALQKQATDMESAFSYVADKANKKIQDLQDKRKSEEDYWNSRIEALRAENEALEDNIALQEAQEALARAKANKVRVYREGQGFVYEEDVTAVSEARKNLDKLNREQQLKDEVARLEKLKKQALDNIDTQIKRWEDYSKSWSEVASNYKKDQDKLLAEQVFGINTEQSGWEERLGNAKSFVAQYNALMAQIGAASMTGAGASTGGGGGGGYVYDITTKKGKDIASNLGTGQTYKASDGSTWKKNSDGSLSVTTKSGNTYAGKYASGTLSARPGMANVDEHGSELILRNPPSGRMTYMEKGDGVVPANLTKNLMEWGKFNPSSFTPNSTGGGSSIVYQIDNLTLPSVRNAEDLINGLQTLKTRAMQKSKSRE